MESQTRRLNDASITAACNSLGARAVFQKMAEGVMPDIEPKNTAIVKNAEARAAASSTGAAGTESADALTRAVERMAQAGQ
jgi:hypothetical protein